jgi:guanine nucleotide-binding protein subunit beta-like protein 1
VCEFQAHSDGNGVLRLDATGPSAQRRIFSQGRDGLIKVWDASTLLAGDTRPAAELFTGAQHFCQFALPRWPQESGSSEFSHSLLAPCSEQGRLQLWDLRSSTKPHTSIDPADPAHRGMVMCCRLLDSSALLPAAVVVAGHEDGFLACYDLRSAARGPLVEAKLHSEPLMCCDIDAAAAQGVSASAGSTISTWRLDLAAGSCTPGPQFALRRPGVSCVELRSDCELFAAGCWDSQIRLYRWRQPVPLAVLPFHEGSVNSIAFCPTATAAATGSVSGQFAAGSKDCRISMWNMYGS